MKDTYTVCAKIYTLYIYIYIYIYICVCVTVVGTHGCDGDLNA
jgi:hypothetical protein